MAQLFKVSFTSLLLLLCVYSASARDFTQPTSVALRTEVSHVVEVKLIEKKFSEELGWQLFFEKIADIHNTSTKDIITPASADTAKSLALDTTYIIAYETHRKKKIKGIKKYIPISNGSVLMNVEGGSPAIYRSHELLKKQLTTDPQLAKTDVNKLLNNIMAGIAIDDPQIQEFFVRELVNWIGLPNQLNSSQSKQLTTVFNSNSTSIKTLTALLESRPALHQAMDIKLMAPQVTKLLEVLPLNHRPDSEVPALILEALNFANNHDLGNWHLYQRWTRSNSSAIAEKALLSLDKINPEKTNELAQNRSQDTLLSDASRRVMLRYLNKR